MIIFFKISDQIIEVNGQTFSRISQTDAKNILINNTLNCIATNSPLKLLVRYLGKYPMLTKYNLENIKEFDLVSDSEIDIEYKANDQDENFLNDEKTFLTLNLTKKQQNIARYYFKEYNDLKISIFHFTYQMKKCFGKVIYFTLICNLKLEFIKKYYFKAVDRKDYRLLHKIAYKGSFKKFIGIWNNFKKLKNKFNGIIIDIILL